MLRVVLFLSLALVFSCANDPFKVSISEERITAACDNIQTVSNQSPLIDPNECKANLGANCSREDIEELAGLYPNEVPALSLSCLPSWRGPGPNLRENGDPGLFNTILCLLCTAANGLKAPYVCSSVCSS